MTMIYVAVFVVLVGVLIFRVPAAVRTLSSRMTWISVLLAIFAMVALGTVVPIDQADALLGGSNVIWLMQCILATLAFWAFSEAALSVDEGGEHRFPARSVIAPLAWCVAFTVPFLLSSGRGTTVVHFSRVHATDLWVFVSAVIYMAGVSWMVARIVRISFSRVEAGYRLFTVGSVLIVLACVCEAVVMILVRFAVLDSHTGCYLLFEVMFYPGVVCIAVGMLWFSLRRRLRLREIRTRADRLRRILRDRGIELPGDDKVNDTYAVYALLVRITDHRVLGDLVLTRQEARIVDAAETWVEEDLPQMLEAAG